MAGPACPALRRRGARVSRPHPDGTVVALGEGLETQLWRVDNGRVEWVSVDLPEVVELRERLLPASPRQRLVGASAFDTGWLDEVDPSRGVLVTAQGLLMYFERDEAYRLIADCAGGFPAGASCSTSSRAGSPSAAARASSPGPVPSRLRRGSGAPGRARSGSSRRSPAVRSVKVLRQGRGRGPIHGFLLPLLASFPPVRRRMPSILQLEFDR